MKFGRATKGSRKVDASSEDKNETRTDASFDRWQKLVWFVGCDYCRFVERRVVRDDEEGEKK